MTMWNEISKPVKLLTVGTGVNLIVLFIAYNLSPFPFGPHDGQLFSKDRKCRDNLEQIDVSKDLYALDYNMTNGQSIPGGIKTLVGPQAYIKKMPRCPKGGTYTINPIGINPTCDYNATSEELPHVLQSSQPEQKTP